MKRNKNNCDLTSCSFCRGCLKEWLPALDINRQTYDFKKGEVIFTEGEVVTGVYFLNVGKVKVHKKWGEDKELIIRFAGPGDILGHRGLGKELTYPISATSIEPVTACFIDINFFLTSLKVNHAYAFELLMFYAEELQESEKNMRNLAHLAVKGRVAYSLLKLKDKFGTNDGGLVNVSISRHDLASYAGTTYETAFRVMTEFVQQNLVSFSGKDIAILNEKELNALIM